MNILLIFLRYNIMPTKKKVLQKQRQKQRQSVVVNVNLAKARARASAKKSGKKGGGRGSIMMLPPPIYASPIDRLTPAMYSSQGQQIQQQSLDQMLKKFLTNQEKQNVAITPNKLGSASYYPGSSSVSYNPSSRDDVSEISEDSLNTEWENYNKYTNIGENIRRDKIQDLKGSQLREQFNKFKNEVPSLFQNEERSYLSASEPNYESTAPKFSQNEARVSQGNIYESIKNLEPTATDRSSKHFYDMLNRMEEKTQKEISNLQIPEPFRRPDRRPPVRIQLEDNESVLSENPFPERMYNKMMGFN
jgi:hypothetical protein